MSCILLLPWAREEQKEVHSKYFCLLESLSERYAFTGGDA